MRQVVSEGDFRRLVVDSYESLPKQQQLVATYLLDHLREAPFLAVPELAQRSGASEATVVRLAQRLGYSGFTALRSDLLAVFRQKMLNQRTVADGLPPEVDEDTLARVARLEIENIAQSIEEIDSEAFRRTAAALLRADHVYTFGLGISAHLAALTTYLLTQIGVRSTALATSYSSPLEQLVTLRPTDLVLAFSFPPYSRQTLELVGEAERRGVPTVALCDRPTAPVATLARHTIAARSENLMFTNAFSAVSVLLNALTTDIAFRSRAHAAEAVGRISRILDDDDNVLEGGP
jgi:DNA-binding MurR/RpiR family transcriptional regulator